MTTTQAPSTEQPKTASDAGARPYATVNPYTGKTEKEFPFLETDAIDGVVERAHAAFGDWRRRSVEERAAVVGRAAELMRERQDELAALITREMGKRIQEAAGEVQLAASILEYYATNGPRFLAPKPIDVMGGGEAEVVNEPIGVLLAIEPWNYPLYQVVRVAGPNLTLGNTVLLKHAENNPQCALALEQLFRDAGAPEGVYTNLFLRIADVEQVVADRRVQGVTLTGSERAGASVAQLAGKHLKKSVLELGGSDPFIVLDAPDLGRTVKAATMARMANTGQACIAAKRIIVLDEVYDDVVAGLQQAFGSFSPGDPADPATTLGPLSTERAAQDLAAQIQDAVDKGATVLTGGGRPEHDGAFVQATLLADVTPEMRAYHEELFGPAAVVYRAKDADEAVALANDSDFGLSAAVYSGDTERAREVADRLESGMVWINQPSGSSPELPFGGVKRSGYGRELSELGMFEFANRRLVRTMPPKKQAAPAQHVGG
ncbi:MULTISPECIES: NAD-dependent succinate-semialdehyde dehydrogenase [unclassified Modestobacter]|uniref:NAD-dependent succinate-semialdehyde dehydrogenase n=1 Tax=unclassified Modestobacter TaxID=2643866 RepID=UPI0022AA5386|nr:MULTISPECIES: NAD-dependent succinate-semialdehyde dehydrogenase [unclassified Modestobacter]MCZ2823909.1 NAD-dependent succinate-semialdehyde dehydrogenase [Modestobacter sp. VKM Ac-2981]MCZ2852154.1 NAD-dependent succinate-semialdehyde dehydrogenase [Modestobacter sp. VKM Ac-2982]